MEPEQELMKKAGLEQELMKEAWPELQLVMEVEAELDLNKKPVTLERTLHI